MNQTSPSYSPSHRTEHSHHQKHSSRITTLRDSISDLGDIDTKVNDWKLPDPDHPSSSIDDKHECHAHSPLVHEFNEKKIIEAITSGGCSPYAQKRERCEAPDERHGDGRGLPALPSPIPVSSSISRSRPCPHHWHHEQLDRESSAENPMEVKENSGKSSCKSRCKRGFSSNDQYRQLYCPFKPSDKVATGISLSVLLQLRRLARCFNAGNTTLVSVLGVPQNGVKKVSKPRIMAVLLSGPMHRCVSSVWNNFNIRKLNQKAEFIRWRPREYIRDRPNQ